MTAFAFRAPATHAVVQSPCEAGENLAFPASPHNLRIIGGLDAEARVEPTSGPNAGPEAESAAYAPHDYFETLAARPDCLVAVSLRDPGHVERYKFGNYAGIVSYDPTRDTHPLKQDATKLYWPENVLNMTQMRFPIGLTRPGRVLIVVDQWFDRAWLTEMKYQKSDGTIAGLDGYKMLQVTKESDRIWFEPQLRFASQDGYVGRVAVRGYGAAVPPTVKGGPGVVVNGKNYGSDNLGPMSNEFGIKAETWTRFYIDVEERAGEDFAHASLWVADETRDPVPVLINAQMTSNAAGEHTQFWIEYNSSRPNRVGAPMTAYVRNLVVLRNLSNPASVFARPMR